jgi:hypothetical protein
MSTPYHPDHPDLTRHALGEPPDHGNAELADAVLRNPALGAEVSEIQELAGVLSQSAPPHVHRLHPAQRKRVLTPPRPASPVSRRVRSSFPVAVWLGRAAAAAILVFAGYQAGRFQSSEGRVAGVETGASLLPDRTEETAAESVASEAPAVNTESAMVAAAPQPSLPAPSPVSPLEPAAAEPAGPSLTEVAAAPSVPAIAAGLPDAEQPSMEREPTLLESVLPGSQPAEAAARPEVLLALAHGVAGRETVGALTSASRSPASRLNLQPALIKPPRDPAPRALDAKPLAPGAAGKGAAPSKRADLFIHAWRSEVTSCPWNPERRLLQLSIQLPADQEAASMGSTVYPLEVSFDSHAVRDFRLLASRAFPAAEKRSAGRVVYWYEFSPNGATPGSEDAPKRVATLSLPGVRFTTKTVGPFSTNGLEILDRGREWTAARPDFNFETALMGLGLLLDAAPNPEGLDHSVLLRLAKAGIGSDPDGSRTEFVTALRRLAHFSGRP